MSTISLPNHRIVDCIIEIDTAVLVVMSNAVLFDIAIQASDFLKTSLGEQLRMWLDKLAPNYEAECFEENPDDIEVFEDFCDWLIQPCVGYIRQNAPAIKETISLQTFSCPPRHALQLLPIDGFIRAVPIDKHHLTSAIPMVSASSSNIPPDVRRVSAADVFLIQDPNSQFDPTCDIPRRVHVAASDLFFKSITTSADFEREVSVLHRILKLGLSVNVSRLYAIVVSTDEKSIIGILIDWLPFGRRNLWNKDFIQMKEYHVVWETQVRKIVETLHVNNIVWGDVNPGNIVIDYELNAWIVDFAGGFVEQFVDKESAGTKQGDWNGIHNIFRNWLSDGRSGC